MGPQYTRVSYRQVRFWVIVVPAVMAYMAVLWLVVYVLMNG